MKEWFCEHCGRREKTSDKIIIKICSSCIELMIIEGEGNGQS